MNSARRGPGLSRPVSSEELLKSAIRLCDALGDEALDHIRAVQCHAEVEGDGDLVESCRLLEIHISHLLYARKQVL